MADSDKREQVDWPPSRNQLYIAVGVVLVVCSAFLLGLGIGYQLGYYCGAYDGVVYTLDTLAETFPTFIEDPLKESIREEVGERPRHCGTNHVAEYADENVTLWPSVVVAAPSA